MTASSLFLVEFGLHTGLRPFFPKGFFELFTEERIFFVVRNRRATIFHIDSAIVDRFFSGSAAFTSRSIGAEPGRESERLLAGAEVSMEPVAAHGCRADHTDGLIVLPLNQFGLAGFPRPCSQGAGPGVSIAFALEADEHGGRTVGVSFRVAAVFVLSDPKIKAIAGHVRLDAPVTMSGIILVCRIARPRTGSGAISSLYL